MLITVIICTYRRAADLGNLLNCLHAQTHRDVEVLVVDGSGDDSAVCEAVELANSAADSTLDVRLIPAAAGLTRQRNVGLQHARGDIICFFDDDVTFDQEFLAQVVEFFEQPGRENVGGVCGYDVLNYPAEISFRWRLRRWLGTVHCLQPGSIDRLGRSVPLSFAKPFSGSIDVGWLSGFCMIYRRQAVAGMKFDEQLPTYGGEDRDFSMRVGRDWRLNFCGELRLKHHGSLEHRVLGNGRLFQTGFGSGRVFAKNFQGLLDYATIGRYLAGEFLIDMLAFFHRPSRTSFMSGFSRSFGVLAGYRSLKGSG